MFPPSPPAGFQPPAVLAILLTLAALPPDCREDTIDAVRAAMAGGEPLTGELFAAAEAAQ